MRRAFDTVHSAWQPAGRGETKVSLSLTRNSLPPLNIQITQQFSRQAEHAWTPLFQHIYCSFVASHPFSLVSIICICTQRTYLLRHTYLCSWSSTISSQFCNFSLYSQRGFITGAEWTCLSLGRAPRQVVLVQITIVQKPSRFLLRALLISGLRMPIQQRKRKLCSSRFIARYSGHTLDADLLARKSPEKLLLSFIIAAKRRPLFKLTKNLYRSCNICIIVIWHYYW